MTNTTDDQSRLHGVSSTRADPKYPLPAWFLGPKAEQAHVWSELLTYVFQDYVHWRRNYFPDDPVTISRRQQRAYAEWRDLLAYKLDVLLNKLKSDMPFHSPRYVAHMTSELTLPGVLGYLTGFFYNPN